MKPKFTLLDSKPPVELQNKMKSDEIKETETKDWDEIYAKTEAEEVDADKAEDLLNINKNI